MSEILVPIALSSQLDVTGEERIHAAKYTPSSRAAWTAPPWEYFIWQSGVFGAGSAKTGYARVNTDTLAVEEIAMKVGGAYPPKSHAGCNIGGQLITYDSFINDEVVFPGVYAYKYDGTSTLALETTWRINGGAPYDEYFSLCKWDANTVIVIAKTDTPTNRTFMYALGYDGAAFTEEASLNFGNNNSYQVRVHKGHLILWRFYLGDNASRLSAYSFDGSTFTLVATYPGDNGAGSTALDRLEVDDNYIYTGDGRIFSFNGTDTLSLVATAGSVSSQKFAALSGAYVASAGGSTETINVYSFDGATATLASTFDTDPRTVGHGWWTPLDDLIFAPGPSSYSNIESAIYRLTGTTLTREADFILPTLTGERASVTFIDQLTEY